MAMLNNQMVLKSENVQKEKKGKVGNLEKPTASATVFLILLTPSLGPPGAHRLRTPELRQNGETPPG